MLKLLLKGFLLALCICSGADTASAQVARMRSKELKNFFKPVPSSIFACQIVPAKKKAVLVQLIGGKTLRANRQFELAAHLTATRKLKRSLVTLKAERTALIKRGITRGVKEFQRLLRENALKQTAVQSELEKLPVVQRACNARRKFLLAPVIPPPSKTLVDNFDSLPLQGRWKADNGAEYPGATVSLATGLGRSGTGMRLNYDFRGGGRHVSARYSFPQPQNAAAIGFWARAPIGIRIVLRVEDATGQSLQYPTISYGLGSYDSAKWYYYAVDLSTAAAHWGGVNNGEVSGGITALSLHASEPSELHPQGTIEFDDITLLSSLVVEVEPASTSLVRASTSIGSLSSALGVNIHFIDSANLLDLTRSAGFTWLRRDLHWPSVESTPGSYDFEIYDRLVEKAAARGMKVLFILSYGHAYYTGTNATPPTQDYQIQAFSNFAAAAAAHFAGTGAAFEIWNEPDLVACWPPTPNPDAFGTLLSAATAAIRQADPTASVVSGGLSYPKLSYLQSLLHTAAASNLHAVGLHLYDRVPESFLSKVAEWRDVVKALVPNNLPTWGTEGGASATWFGDGHSSEARLKQAITTVRYVVTSWSLGLPVIIVYDMIDNGPDGFNVEHNFGMVTEDLSEKPVMTAVRTLTTLASGKRLKGFHQLGIDGVLAAQFESSSEVVVAAWSRGPTLPLLFDPTSEVVDLFGNVISPLAAGGKAYVVLSPELGPVYLKSLK